MQKFDVHSYLVVRIKVEGVDAENAEAAIQAVQDDTELQSRMARMVHMDREGEQISAIELDEGALATGYLVDLVGDEDHQNTRSFDVGIEGELIEHGKEPGRNVPVSVLQRAALYALSDDDISATVDRSTDQHALFENLKKGAKAAISGLIAQQIAGLTADQRDEAMARLDSAIGQLTLARDAVADLPNSLDYVFGSIVQRDLSQDVIPVIVNGKEVGTLQRPRASGGRRGLWRNAAFVISHTPVAWGMNKALAYIRETYGIQPEMIIEIHPGYHAIYGQDGSIFARIIANEDGFHLRVFEPHLSGKHSTLEYALLAAGVSGTVAREYARLHA